MLYLHTGTPPFMPTAAEQAASSLSSVIMATDTTTSVPTAAAAATAEATSENAPTATDMATTTRTLAEGDDKSSLKARDDGIEKAADAAPSAATLADAAAAALRAKAAEAVAAAAAISTDNEIISQISGQVGMESKSSVAPEVEAPAVTPAPVTTARAASSELATSATSSSGSLKAVENGSAKTGVEVLSQELREALLSGIVDLGILGLWRATAAPPPLRDSANIR
jgi:peptidoglycan DL-endopeptidase CwlO